MSVSAVMLASAMAMGGQAVQVQTYESDTGWVGNGGQGGYVQVQPSPCGPSPCQAPPYAPPPPCGPSPCGGSYGPPPGYDGGYDQGYAGGGYGGAVYDRYGGGPQYQDAGYGSYDYHGFWKNRGPNIPIGCPIPHPGPPTCGQGADGGYGGHPAPLPANFFWGYGGGVGPTVVDGGGGGGRVIVFGGGGARASASAYASARASVHVGGGGRGHGHGGKGGCCR